MLIKIGLLIKVTQSGPNEMKFLGTVQFNLSFQMVLSVFDLVEKKYQKIKITYTKHLHAHKNRFAH